jgi:uncharacterized membrane protein
MEPANRRGRYWHRTPQLESEYRPLNVNLAERITSAAVGLALVFFGVRRRSLLGRALAATGGALVERAASGRCAVYAALRLSSA